jgi:hypothetical protein
MFLIKCVPIVGTLVTAGEAIDALANGDGKTFLAKTVQTCIGGVLDAAFIVTAGTSSLVTSPLKPVLEGGKIAGKMVLEKMVVQKAGKITTNIAARALCEALCDIVAEKASRGGGRGRGGGGLFSGGERGGSGTGDSGRETTSNSNSTSSM